MTTLPSVRELLAFANHTENLQNQGPATQFAPKAAAAIVGCASRQTSDSAEPIVLQCSVDTNTNTNAHANTDADVGAQGGAVATAADGSKPEPEATVKQRPGRKARSGSRYSAPSGARQYKCGLQSCLAVFKRPEHLKRHMLTHTQVRPFLCEAANCGKRFSRRDNYITHMKKHEPEDLPASFVSEGISRSSSRCSSTKVRRTDEMSDATGSSSERSGRQAPTSISSIQALLNEDSDNDSERSDSRLKRAFSSSSISSSIDSNGNIRNHSIYGSASPGPLPSGGHRNSQQPAQALPPLELLAHASTQTAASPDVSKLVLDSAAQNQDAAPASYDRPAVAFGLAPTQAIRVSLSTESQVPSDSCAKADCVVTDQSTQHVQKQKMDLSAVSSSFLFAAGDPSKPFMCSICESRFGRLEHVRRHHLVHTGQRKYECPTCGKTFARKDNMVQHMRAHERKKETASPSSKDTSK